MKESDVINGAAWLEFVKDLENMLDDEDLTPDALNKKDCKMLLCIVRGYSDSGWSELSREVFIPASLSINLIKSIISYAKQRLVELEIEP